MLVPSPKYQVYRVISPSGSCDPVPLNRACVVLMIWSGPASACGDRLVIVNCFVLDDCDPLLSVIVNVMVYVPIELYVCRGCCSCAVVPSSKSHCQAMSVPSVSLLSSMKVICSCVLRVSGGIQWKSAMGGVLLGLWRVASEVFRGW